MSDLFTTESGSCTNIVEMLVAHAKSRPDQPVFTFLEKGEETGHLSFSTLDMKARIIAGTIRSKASSIPERALLLYPQGLDFITAFMGCLYAGVIAVPINFLDPNRFIKNIEKFQAIATDTRADMILTTSKVMGKLDETSRRADGINTIQWITTDKIGETSFAETFTPVSITPEDLAFLQYTSGSTGTPKGIMVSHKNLWDNCLCFQNATGNTPRDCLVDWTPHFHDMGLIMCILQSVFVGMHCVRMSPLDIMQNPYCWLRAISKYKGTISCAPNFAYDLCVDKIREEQLTDLDLSTWEVAITGAETIHSGTLQRFAEKFSTCGFQYNSFCPAWGLAEATALVTCGKRLRGPVIQHVDKDALSRGKRADAAKDSDLGQDIVGCGVPVKGKRVMAVNPETCEPCKADEIGEIWLQCGDSTPAGYLNRPRETADTYDAYLAGTKTGPFLRTGDLGFVRDDELFFTGRMKDLIIIRGVNYYPQDIESSVQKGHKDLIFGVGAAFSVSVEEEEYLVVVNELRKDSDYKKTQEIIGIARREVSRNHGVLPHAVVLIEQGSIPKTPGGKIRRQACKSAYLNGQLAVVDKWQAGIQPSTKIQTEDSSADSIPVEQIRDWLISAISRITGLSVNTIEVDTPFIDLGLDSLMAGELTGALSTFLNRSIEPVIIYDYPTIASLSHKLGKKDEPITRFPITSQEKIDRHEPVAVIGMACRFPGANNISSYWELLASGKDAVCEVPADRWDIDAYYDATGKRPGTMNTRWGGFLDDVDMFDARFFNISPEEAAAMDPQQRLFMEISWEALEHAGQMNANLAGSATGVFAGVSMHDYDRLQNRTKLNLYMGTGNTQCIIANRLSHFLGLQGPSMAIDTACSSSLVSVHLAMNSLKNMECDLALAGGVNLILDPDTTVIFSQADFLSPTGRCRTFDANADGYIRSEGCGVVVLKRYADALRDKDNILAVLRGSAVNQDGFSNGLTAPNGLAQQAVIRKAMNNASVSPQDISYLEAHGTGTPLGDPIEVGAMEAVFADRSSSGNPLWIGSVKTNIGHAEAAAGIAGLIKVVLSLQHQEIPPHLHLKELNPLISLDRINGMIPKTREPWVLDHGQRYAGVSSFGFGGTNAHVIVSEAPALENSPNEFEERPFHLFTLSALTKDALYSSARQYKTFLETSPQIKTGDICFTVNTGRKAFPHRLAACVSSNHELKAYLENFLQGREQPGHIQGDMPKVAFLFTGQGSQYKGMGQQLYASQPEFRKAMDQCDQVIQENLGIPVSTILFKDDGLLNQAIYVQPALFALEYSLAQMWISWGVVPQAVMGHSLGEYVAACVAGIMSPENGLRLVMARSRLMHGLPRNGKMAAVFASWEQVNERITPFAEWVSVAAFNGPEHVVVSGRHDKIDELVNSLTEEGIGCWALDVSHAFHSPLMDPILDEFETEAASISYAPAKIPLVSNLTGDFLGDRICDAGYWREHLRNPVRFASGVTALHQENFGLFLEIGPRPVLSGMAEKCLEKSNHMFLASLMQDGRDWQQAIKTLGALYLGGIPLHLDLLDQGYDYKRVPVPTYPFERQRYWIEDLASAPEQREPSSRSSKKNFRPLLGRRIRTPLNQAIYETRFDYDHPLIREHTVYHSGVMSGSTYIEMLLEALSDTFGETKPCLDNIVVQSPMSVSEKGFRNVQLIMDQQNICKVFSSDPSCDVWTLHLSGQVKTNSAAASEKYNESVESIRSRCSNTQDTQALYKEIRDSGLQLGPQFQWMEKIWYNDKEALVLMREPRQKDFAHTYQIHPGLIDSCAQSIIVSADFDKDSAYMFLGYDRYQFMGASAQRLWCHTRFKEKNREIMSGDYDLFAEDGTLVASARGVYAKRAPAKAFFHPGLQTYDHSFYHLEWIEQPPSAHHVVEKTVQQETWVIFADSSSLTDSFLHALKTEEIDGILVVPGVDYIRQSSSSYQLNPSDPEHFQRLFSETGQWQHILYLWGMADAFTDTLTESSLKKALSLCCGGLLHLTQAIGDSPAPPKGHLWCITCNAHPLADDKGLLSRSVNPVQTSLWGLARVIDNEVDNFHTHLIDLSSKDLKTQTNRLIDEIRQPINNERQVAFSSGKRFVPRLVPAKPSAQDTEKFHPKPNLAYLITGGAGGLGQMLMEWLVRMGARHLVLVGRSDLTQSLDNRIQELTQDGLDIDYFQADVTKFEEIRTVLDKIPELGGIFHLAGALDDGILLQKNWLDFERVMAPKAFGSWNLHLLTKERGNAFLVLFSSIASFMGIPGQGDYAAANAFMDGLIAYRHHKGLSGTSINWGPWADVGMAAHLDDTYWMKGGIQLISSESGFDLMKQIPEDDGRPVAIAWADWKQFAENILHRPVSAMMSQLVHADPAEPERKEFLPGESPVLSDIQNAADADKQDMILAYVRSQVEKTVWIDSEKQIDQDAPLMNIGFDSLKILELRNRIRQDLKTDLSLGEMIKDASILNLSRAIGAKFGVVQSDTFELPPLIPDDAHKYEPFPLTDVQHAYWIGRDNSFELGNNACHVYLEADFKDIDLKRLERALNQLIAHHDMLRAIVLLDGQQQILKTVPVYDIDVLDLREAENQLVDSKIEELRTIMSHQMIPADQWPLFEIRATLFKDNRTRIHISFDLLIGDGGTFNILIGDLFRLYNGEPLEPISISFRDYVMAEKSLQDTQGYKKALAYWAERDLPPAPNLPLAVHPGRIENPEFVRRHARLKKSEWDSLRQRGTQAGLTPSMILLAAFAEIFRYWSRSPEFTIVLSLFNRQPLHPEVEKLAGDFTSLILLAVAEKENSTFEERAQMLQQQLWKDMEHRIVSGVQAVRQMSHTKNSSAMTFPVVFTSALPYTDGEAFSLSEHIPFEVNYCISQTPQVWIDHQVTEKDGELVLIWDVVEELFPKDVLDDMFTTYVSLLKLLIQQPSSWGQTQFDLLPESQLAVRESVNATQAPVSNQLLHAMFFEQADQNPDREALVTSEKRMTYRELALRAEQIGQYLISHNVHPNELVAVVMEKGWEQVVAVLGILWAGAAYLPISASMPRARRDKILENGQVNTVLTQSRFLEIFDWPEAVQCLAVDQAGFSSERIPFQPTQKSTDLAYVIYTSGSTGDPKGVMIDHRGAVNTICDINRRFNINHQDCILGLAELSFDLSVYDIFGILGLGAKLVIPDVIHAKDPSHWLTWMDKEAITIWNSVPQHMQMLMEFVSGKTSPLPDSLRLVLLSGDWIPLDLPEKIRTHFPHAQVISLGGATEASIWSILYPIEHVNPQWKSIPYGRPMDNQQFYVLNKDMSPCPDWVIGDLYIGGIGLAKGYRGDKEKTDASFIHHPVTGIPLYRTGDMGRFLPNGNIEFQGRGDFQVKILGHRIELGEIEAVLKRHHRVKDALVSIYEDGSGNKHLAGYLVTGNSTKDTPDNKNSDADNDLTLSDWESLGNVENLLIDPMERLEFKMRKPGVRRTKHKGQYIDIPGLKLDTALMNRYSQRLTYRKFETDRIELTDIQSFLRNLSAVQVPEYPFPKYQYGSAGGLYPVQVYFYFKPNRVGRVAEGIYYFNPLDNILERISGDRIHNNIVSSGNVRIFDQAAFAVFMIADLDAIIPIYGDYSRKFCLLEAGVMTQLMETTCFENGIGLCQIGVLDFCQIAHLFKLKPNQEFIHCLFGGKVTQPSGWTFLDEISQDYVRSVKASGEKEQRIKDVNDYLAARLPGYMIPAFLMELEKLPLGANGKVDRKALPKPSLDSSQTIGKGSTPITLTEKKLAQIWQKLFDLETVLTQDNFFKLGGDSLLAVRLVTEMHKEIGVKLSIAELYANPDIAGLSALIQKESNKPETRDNECVSYPLIVPDKDDPYGPFPLTYIQEAYWIGRNKDFELGNVSTHFYIEIDSDELDIKRLNMAWQKVLERHEMLRSLILPDGTQKILKKVPFYEFQIHDMSPDSEDEAKIKLSAIREKMSHQVMPFDVWPLFDIQVSILPGGSIRLHISCDALVADAWSYFTIINDWQTFYENDNAQLESLNISFRDYVIAEKRLEGTPLHERDKQYWTERLPSLPPAPELPLAKNPAEIEKAHFERRSYILPSADWERFKTITKNNGLTPSGALVGVYAEILNKWSKTDQFCINLTMFNRLPLHPQVNLLVGDFTSLVILEVDQSGPPGFLHRASKIQDQLWRDLDHRHYNGVQVLRDIARYRGEFKKSTMPVVFTSALNLDPLKENAQGVGSLGTWVYGISQTPQVWLDHQVVEQDGGLMVIWDAVEELFPPGMLDDMFAAYCNLLKELARSDEMWKAQVPPPIPEEQLKKRIAVNDTDLPVPSSGMLHGFFEKQVVEQPDQLAVISEENMLTYKQLQVYANTLAHTLLNEGVKPNTLVVVFMDKGWEQIVGTLAILKAGAAYLPVDPETPRDRFVYLLENSEARVILTQSWLKVHEVLPGHIVRIDVDRIKPLDLADSLPIDSAGPDDLAYVIYTSGSTGLPKGVMISHQSAVNTILDLNLRFEIGPEDRVLALANLNFDLSVYDIFGTLAAGAAIVLPNADKARNPDHWLGLIQTRNVTIWNSAPALMQMLIDYINTENQDGSDSLRLVWLSGDWIPLDLPDTIRNAFRKTKVIGLGGATEASIWSNLYPIHQVDPSWKSIPYGKPMTNQHLYVLDNLMHDCPDWVTGDLYIGGTGVAQGYWKDEVKTTSSFSIHPRTGEPLYKTGDLARYLPDGNVEFQGREDFQIKIRGYRIELGEIEAVLEESDLVQEAVVVPDGKNENNLGAAVILKEGLSLGRQETLENIQAHLGTKLPKYMIPHKLISLDALPLNHNGKVDRKFVKKQLEVLQETSSPYSPPSGDLEIQIASVWSEVLEIENPSRFDDFFLMGGDSLKAISLIRKLSVKNISSQNLSLRVLFANPTIETLANQITHQRQKENISQLTESNMETGVI